MLLSRFRHPLRKATIKQVSGNTVSITFDGITTYKGVPVIGDTKYLYPGQLVTVLCVDNRPIVFAISGWGNLPPLVNGEILVAGGGIEGPPVTIHSPVTFGSSMMSNIFTIDQYQEMDLVTQDPNEFLAGPTGGPPVKPYFRGLVTADLPAIDLNDLDNVDATSPSDGDILVYNSTSFKWEKTTPSNNRQSILTVPGALTVAANPLRIYNRLGVAQSITEIYACVGTAPTGSGVTATVAGTSVTIAAGSNTGITTPGSPINWASGAYISMAVTAIGSTVAGSDLVVHIVHH